ncbi:hypothetical protein DRQ20_01270 [bacterium]|nr:MAG: hypothetical protein DRQ20_01270 [bacterium]
MKRVFLFLLFLSCATTIQRGETLRRGEIELGYGAFVHSIDWSCQVYGFYGLTGITDVGISGEAMLLPIPAYGGCFIQGRQKILGLRDKNFIVSGKYGYIWSDERTSYWQWDFLLGIKRMDGYMAIGGGMVYNPWFFYRCTWESCYFLNSRPVYHVYLSVPLTKRIYGIWELCFDTSTIYSGSIGIFFYYVFFEKNRD